MPIKCFIPPRYGIYCGSFQWPLRGGQAEELEARQTVWRPIRGSERPARGSGGQSECLGGQLMGWGGHPETLGGQKEALGGQPEGQRGQPKGLGGQPDSLGGELGSGPYGTEYLWYRVGQRPLWYHTEILILRHLDVEEVIESQARVLPFAIFLQNSKLNTPSGLASLFFTRL